MKQILPWLHSKDLTFPAPSNALSDPNGLLALGGDLSKHRILNAYQDGIFPWYNDGDPIMWWSPDPRTVIDLADFKVNRTLQKVINRSEYSISFNTCFERIIHTCADAPFRSADTWIIDEMIQAYISLHQEGFAHSVEVWHNNTLVGGLYGVALGGYFSGESMFYIKSNASKVALWALTEKLKSINVEFIDCQLMNPFLATMGAKEISREEFFLRKNKALSIHPPKDFWSTN